MKMTQKSCEERKQMASLTQAFGRLLELLGYFATREKKFILRV